ncbi:hypothetical protein M9Y10_021960 [Tritrichomonas musculus]|uniref:Importin N-terminal domain-containing protein n=1 Tax=Tritrichomonas musculus TaxID=1915356 RepID=A0ABR2KRU0_9EUKA
MDANILIQITNSLKSNEANEEVLNYRNLYAQLNSSSESIPLLLPIYTQVDDSDVHLVILQILYNRIYNFWNEISEDNKGKLLTFFFKDLTNDYLKKYIESGSSHVVELIAQCQARIASFYYPEGFPILWKPIAFNFELEHFFYFVAYFFSAVASPNLQNLSQYQKIRAGMLIISNDDETSIDNVIFSKIISGITTSQTAIFALASYVKWGYNYQVWFENKDIFNFILTSLNSNIIELINNTITRLNIASTKLVTDIPLVNLFNQVKDSIQKQNEDIKLISCTASLINNIAITLEHIPDLLGSLHIFEYVLFFLNYQDVSTTNAIIPALTYYIQILPQESIGNVIDAILGRIIRHHQSNGNINMEDDLFVKSLCNVMSKTDPNILVNILKAKVDDPNFESNINITSAVLSVLSYMNYLPFDIQLYVYRKIEPFFTNNLKPNNPQEFFRTYYMLLFLQNINIPPIMEITENIPQEQQAQIQQMNEASQNIFQSMLRIVSDIIIPQFPLYASKLSTEINYQYLKLVRKIVSKIRKFNNQIGIFNPELVQLVSNELKILPDLPEEAAKLIGYLISNDETSNTMQQIISDLFGEFEKQPKNEIISFLLTLISHLKYLKIDENIASIITHHLDIIHSILNKNKLEHLISYLLKAYVVVAPYIINLLPQLLQLNTGTDKLIFDNACLLTDAVLTQCQGIDLSWFPPYFITSSQLLLQNILPTEPTPDQKQIFQKIAKHYCSILKKFIFMNKGNIEQAFSSMIQNIYSQFVIGYNHHYFIEKLTESILPFMECGCPPQVISNNILLYSLCFLFDTNFNHAFPECQEVMETAIKFHTLLIKNSPNEFKAKFSEFLALFNGSERTSKYFEDYLNLCTQADLNNLDAHVSNSLFSQFYNSILSDRNSNPWTPPAPPPSE